MSISSRAVGGTSISRGAASALSSPGRRPIEALPSRLRSMPAARAYVSVVHRDSPPLPIELAHDADADAGAFAVVGIARYVKAGVHHRDVGREKAHMHLRRLAGTRTERPIRPVQALHQSPEACACRAPCAVDGDKLGIIGQRLDHGIRIVPAPGLVESQFNLADGVLISFSHDRLSFIALPRGRR